MRSAGNGFRCASIAVALMACSSTAEKKPEVKPAEPAHVLASDSAPADLSKLSANIPPPVADTFTPIKKIKIENIPDAPPDLMDAAEREESISRFCYQEYGQKVDPKLVGAVAMVVTVDGNAIQAVRVGADDWSSGAGKGVETCLVQKAPQAWKILPGARVPAGKYVIQLRFRPS